MSEMENCPDHELGQLIDLTCDGPAPAGSASAKRRAFLGIHFRCCGVYARIYLNREGSAYQGRCPRCLRIVTIRVAPDGLSERFFTAF